MASTSPQTAEVLERPAEKREAAPIVRPVPEPESKPERFVIKVGSAIPY